MQETQIFTEKWIVLDQKNWDFFVRVLSWEDKWRVIKAQWEWENYWIWEKHYSQWDKVSLYVEKNPDDHSENYSIKWFWHLDAIIVWFFVFCWIVLFIWRKQWLRSLLSLFWSVLIILFLLIPWIKLWYSPVILAWIISFFVTIFTILLIVWNTKKWWIAILWTLSWVFFSYIFAFLIAKTSWIDWLWSENFRAFAITSPWFDYTWIFFSWIIIWALWAVMDTTISIASWLNELKEKVWHIWFKWLWKSWMTIWWDIMWWMINTLVFAYLWTSLIIVLSASVNWVSLVEFLNYDFVSEEILRSIAWTTWLVLSIPLTAFLWAWILWKNKNKW